MSRTVFSPAKFDAWLKANHPDLITPSNQLALINTGAGTELDSENWPESAGSPPTLEEVEAWESEPLTDVEILFNQVQGKLDADEYKRTGKRVDPAGAVSKARAWAATAMLYGGWHYPSEADLSAGANPAILAAIYADPASNTTEESTVAQKRKVLGFTLVMLEGQAFGVQYVAELGAYERTASGAFLVALANDQRDWLELPCGPWESVRAMFLAVLK